MKQKLLIVACMASLIAACSQKTTNEATVPVTQINVEQLIDSIDYDMDLTGLPISDLRVLRNAPLARQGYPFKDSYVRGIYETTSWYDSLMWQFDGNVNFADVKEKEDEPFYDYYYRASMETGLVKYTQEELNFIERIKAREEELRKQNFETPEDLRVNMQNLTNPTQLKEFDSLLCQHLAQTGFAIVPAQHDQLFNIYEQNDYNCFPSFVTTDLYLQLFHLYFDCMMRELETYHLYHLMAEFSYDMQETMKKIYQQTNVEHIEQAAAHNIRFFSVANHLFTGMQADAGEDDIVAEEVNKVRASVDGPSRFMADYHDVMFGYSLFRPRGHYTRSTALKEYFMGMMWLQTVPFGLDHQEEIEAAVLIAYVLKGNPALQQKYNTLNELITYLMGKPDNLSIPQVINEIDKTGLPMEDLLNNAIAMSQLKKNLEEIGNKQTRIRPKYEKTSHNKINVMPQRYQPDAEVLLEMVDYVNKPPHRATPKGMDFFAAMGISAAEQILIEEGQKWKGFKPALDGMKKRMSEIDWQETIATQWMNTLKDVNANGTDLKLPYFMGTPEWDRKDLNAMLASWAELKHDAILYAKQPMGAECGGGGLPDPITKGFVEPNVGFWKKALELLNNTEELLRKQNMLTEKISSASGLLREEVKFLLAISEKELAGTPLSDVEYSQIECIGATFENISLDLVREPNQYLMGWSDVQGADKKVALVADVYTANADNNPEKSILFEAVGNADDIYVVVEIDGYLYLTRGAVFSYREFIQPIDEQRLTDEEWQQQLEENPRKGVPEWMKRIIVPLKQEPVVNEEFFYSSGC